MADQYETVQVKIAYRGRRYYVSSDDLPGLWLWGDDLDELLGDVGPTITDLYKYNRGVDVEVVEIKEGIISRLPSLFIRLFRKGRDKYAIYPVAGQHLTRAYG